MISKDVVIVGGGASGLMCAYTYAKLGHNVTVLEASLKVGKKILVSGNGRCNLTNLNLSSDCYNVMPKQFERFNNMDTLKLFESIGLLTYADEEGRCYPVSNHSSSVLDVLINQLKLLKVDIIASSPVVDIYKDNGFVVVTDKEKYNVKKVVIATGGKSVLDIMDRLGVKYNPFLPSLCGIKTVENNQLISGIRVNANVKVKAKDFQYSENGEVIFKDNGLSGICIFNISARLNWKHIDRTNISLDLMPDMSNSQLSDYLKTRKNLGKLVAKQFFDGMFHKNLGQELLNRCDIDINLPIEKLTDKDIENLSLIIKNMQFSLSSMDTNNQVHNGGVPLDMLTDYLEYKTIPNLYFCGEVVDVDGVCGGYNLQWAWTSGHIVGESL